MSKNKLIRFDWAMKTILRDKANFDVLEGFLAALLEDDNIKILNIIESETNQGGEEDKYNRVDLLVQDSENRKIYIEIQNTRETDYLESLLYSSSKIIVEHQKLGEDFHNISKVISISIMYFNLGFGDDYIYYGTNDFFGINTNSKLIVKKRVELLGSLEPRYKFVEKNIFPEYYLITVERYKNIIQRKIDEWIYIFKNNEVAEGSKSKNIDKAEKKLAEINMSDQERKVYDKFLINTARDRDAINTAKEEGREEGIVKGIVKGKIEGKIEGKTEGVELMIVNGFKAGISIEILSKMAQISQDEIKEILINHGLIQD
ncbi:MAG: Rpn family recombination-promoting nuclease/putative transposase [Bacteroidota bacterium]